MSGGHFDYQQYKIEEIADSVEVYLNGHELDERDLEDYERDYEKGWYDEDTIKYIRKHKRTIPNHMEFGNDTLKELRKGLKILRKAYVYAQRIDWLISGDDGEETFLERLKKDLKEIK